MQFYSTYYKKLANYGQIKEIGEKFNVLDTNTDKALNKDEFANIFMGQTLTEEQKTLLLKGIDIDNDNFITYSEFIPAFIEFDINADAEFSGEEYDFAKKRIEELEKQTQINDQYAILNNLSSTESEKVQAQATIDIYKIERKIIYNQQDIKKKEILIGDKELKIQQIQDFIDQNTLLEFEEAQKYKEIESLNAEKNLLLLKKDISVKKLGLENTSLSIITKERQKKGEIDPQLVEQLENELAVLAQEKISNENLLKLSEKNLDEHHQQVKIKVNEELLTKFFVPEFIKEKTREDLEKQRDDLQLTTQRVDTYSKVSALSLTRAQIIDLSYQYKQTQDPALLQQLEQLGQDQEQQQLDAQIASLKVELLDKKIQLKDVLPRSNQKPFDRLKADLEAQIADLEAQIALLGG